MSYNCGDLFTQDLLDGKEPTVMLYDGPNCTLSSNAATPLKLARKGMVYSDMYDVGVMGDTNVISMINRDLPADIEQVYPNSIRMVDAQSLYVPPHMEVDYTTAPSMAFGTNMMYSASTPAEDYDWKSIDGTFTYGDADDGKGGYNNLRDPNFQSPLLTATTMYGAGSVNNSGPFNSNQQKYYAQNMYGASYLDARVDEPGYDIDFITGDWPSDFDTTKADNLFMTKAVESCCLDPDPNSICRLLFPQGLDCTRQSDPTMFYHFESKARDSTWQPYRGMRTMIVRQKKPWAQFKKDCCTADAEALDFGIDTEAAENACGIFWGPTDDQGACDAVMKDWCHWNSDSEECLCITSTMANPECWDPQCAMGRYSYKNKAQKDILAKHCPAGNVCTQTINEGEGSKDNIMNNVVMQQDCATALSSLNNDPSTSGPMGRMCYQYFQQLNSKNGLTFTPDPDMDKECRDNYAAIWTKYSGMSCNGGTCDISTAAQIPPTGTWPSGFPSQDDPAWSKLNTADSSLTDNVALEAIIMLTIISIFLTAVYILSSIHFLSDDDDAPVLQRKEVKVA